MTSKQLFLTSIAALLLSSTTARLFPGKPNKCVTNADCASNQWCNEGQCLTFEPKTQLTSYISSRRKSLSPPPPPPASEPCEHCSKATFEPMPFYGYNYPAFLSFRDFYPSTASTFYMSSPGYSRIPSLITYQQLSQPQQSSTAQSSQTPSGYTPAFSYYSYIPYYPNYYSYESSPYYGNNMQYAQYRQYPFASYAYA